MHSVLDDIPTIGETRRKALMRYFDSIEEIRNATLEELKAVPGMNERSAREVVKWAGREQGETSDRS